MERMLNAIDTISSLTVNPCHRRALKEQVQRIAGLADRYIASTHDRAQITRRMLYVREALESESAVCAGEDKGMAL